MTQIIRENNRIILKPQQNVVVPATDTLRQELKNLVSEGTEELIVDLTGVDIIDSTGLGLLIAAHNSLKKTGGKLVVTNTTADIRELFKCMRLDKHFTVS